MTRRPSDQEIRDEIVGGIGASQLVEASAGTGKTRLMVDRILRLLAEGAAEVEGLVAITFTEKAAGELRLRLRAALGAELRRPDLADEITERYRRALTGLDRATVTTIHAFCAQILRERPIEAGVMPGFAVADDVESARLRDEAWDLWIEGRLADPGSPLRPIFATGVTTQDLRDLADALADHHDLLDDPERALPGGEAAELDETRLFGLWRQEIGELAAELPGLLSRCKDPVGDKAWPKMNAEVDRVMALRDAARDESPDSRRRLLRAAPLPKLGNAGTKKNWPDGSLDRLRALEKAQRDARDAWGRAWAAAIAHRAVQAAAEFLGAWAELKAARGLLDFQDLLVKARDLVRRRPEVRAELQAAWTHLLVDEFQDTDPLQAEIVFYLSDPTAASDGWESARPAPGRLFLVGDPKQSIYRFRRADIDTYNRARGALEAAGGRPLRITENFRTRAPITDWVNRTFARLMPSDGANSFRPPYSPLSPFRREPAGDAGPALLRIDLSGGPAGDGPPKAGERRRREARAVAALLLDAVANERWRVFDRGAPDESGRPARFGDVAILFRTFTPLETYEEVFRAAGVPYRVEGGKYYFQRVEVQSLLAVLRAVDNPLDREALVASLRSPLFAFSDDDLLIAADEESLDLAARVPPSPPGMAEALARLRAWHGRRHLDGPARLLEEILAGTQALEFFSLKPLGEQRVANLLKIVDEAERFQRDAGGFRAFIRHLSEREAALEAEAESPLQEEDDAGDAVQILSIHKSKGLEFPVVILGDLAGTPQTGRDMVIVDRTQGRIGAKLPRKLLDFPAATPGWDELEMAEEAQVAAEQTRLFYVAATRARDLLILPRPEVGKPEGFLALLTDDDWEALPPAPRADVPIPDESPVFRGRLTPPPYDPKQPGPAEIEDARREFIRRRRALLEAWPMAARIVSPSSLETFDPAGRPQAAEQGKRIGRAVHEVLERIAIDGSDLDRQLAAACAANDLTTPADRTRVRRLVDTALHHDLWKRATAAPRMAREAPFLAPEADGGFLDGRVDLIFEDGDGVTIVDYKTDVIGPDGLAPLAAGYRAAGDAYLRALRPRRFVLFFLDANECVVLDGAGLPPRGD